MELIRKEESNHMYILGDDGLKKLDFQFLDEDFVLFFHAPYIEISKETDRVFYEEFSKLFDNRYVFRDGLSYQTQNEIHWVSDEYHEEKDNIEHQNRVVMLRNNNSIGFVYHNDDYDKTGINKRLSIVSFTPLGMGHYSRNVGTGNSFQEDMINTFEYVLKHPKKKSTKK